MSCQHPPPPPLPSTLAPPTSCSLALPHGLIVQHMPWSWIPTLAPPMDLCPLLFSTFCGIPPSVVQHFPWIPSIVQHHLSWSPILHLSWNPLSVPASTPVTAHVFASTHVHMILLLLITQGQDAMHKLASFEENCCRHEFGIQGSVYELNTQ